MVPDSDGYTAIESASWLTVSWLVTATAIGKISSDAVGATMTPPITRPEVARQKSLTKPWRRERIFARGFVDSGIIMVRAEIGRASCRDRGVDAAVRAMCRRGRGVR